MPGSYISNKICLKRWVRFINPEPEERRFVERYPGNFILPAQDWPDWLWPSAPSADDATGTADEEVGEAGEEEGEGARRRRRRRSKRPSYLVYTNLKVKVMEEEEEEVVEAVKTVHAGQALKWASKFPTPDHPTQTQQSPSYTLRALLLEGFTPPPSSTSPILPSASLSITTTTTTTTNSSRIEKK